MGIKQISILAFLLFSLSFLVPEQGSAASGCRNLSANKCKASKECVWVKGYNSKSGKKVASHCRSRANDSKKNRKYDRKSERRVQRRDAVKEIKDKRDKEKKDKSEEDSN